MLIHFVIALFILNNDYNYKVCITTDNKKETS